MDHKEEYFKMFEALSDAKVALEKALKSVKEVQGEVIENFTAKNNSKEDAGRLMGIYFTEGRR